MSFNDAFFASPGGGKKSGGRSSSQNKRSGKRPAAKQGSRSTPAFGRKGGRDAGHAGQAKLQKRKEVLGEDIDSDDSAGPADDSGEDDSDDEYAHETPAEKRLRLAKELIAKIEDEERDQADGKDIDVDAIGDRLRDDLAESKGNLKRKVQQKYKPNYEASDIVSHRRYRGKPVTCIAVDWERDTVFIGAKDGVITKWTLSTGERIVEVRKPLEEPAEDLSTQMARKAAERRAPTGHVGAVLALAVSTDGTFLASGGVDMAVIIWNPEFLQGLKLFRGHRGPVTSVQFRRKSHQLFSGSFDRTLKVWNLDAMSYVETLYGHQEAVLDVDCMDRDRALSCGGRDRSLRVWKVVEESQLVFNGGGESIDCIAMLTESVFVSGSENGTIALWDSTRKKPQHTIRNAHGANAWITTVGALRFGDVAASGSSDGRIKVWACDNGYRKLTPLSEIAIVGIITGIEFNATGSSLVASVAQEHRLGRWIRERAARNGYIHVQLCQ
eukprot:m.867229 g.867229  ORF g.867229 m.867229 type:complete len:497 (+) comp23554_c4_seq3:226-1716(+)